MGARVYTQCFPDPPPLPARAAAAAGGERDPGTPGDLETLPLLQLMNERALPHPRRG